MEGSDKKHPHMADGIRRLCLVLVELRRNFVSTHGTDGPFSLCCVVLVYEEMLWACRASPAAEPPKGAQMKQLIAMAVFVLCFGVGTAHAQRTGGTNNVAGGGGVGPTNSGGGGGGGGFTGAGGGSAVAGVTHHPAWVPPPNVSAKNDGPFLPTTYQDYDKAVEMGKAEVAVHEPTVVEVAKVTQEQRTSAARARFVVVQDVEGKLQEVKAQP